MLGLAPLLEGLTEDFGSSVARTEDFGALLLSKDVSASAILS